MTRKKSTKKRTTRKPAAKRTTQASERASKPAPGTSAPRSLSTKVEVDRAPETKETASPTKAEELREFVLEPAMPGEKRLQMIAEAAYYRSLQRAPGAGSPDEDWAKAEAEIDAMLAAS